MFYNKYLSILSIGALLIASHAYAETPPPAPMMPTATDSATSNAAAIALNVPGTPILISKTATSVTLEWEKVATAKNYIVKYSDTSVAQAFEAGNKNAVYTMESDQVSSTGTTIKDLKTDKNYYFAVVALDATSNESMTNSQELMVTLSTATGTGSTALPTAPISSFKLTSVSVIDAKTLAVNFSAALSTDPVTLKIEKSTDKSSLFVKNIVPGKIPNQVIVNLAASLDPSSSYSLVIVTAKDSKGTSISQGLNALKEFATSATLAKAVVANAIPTTTLTGATLSGGLNAAPPEGSGALVASGALPATGTKETLLLVFAAILSLAIAYIFRNKKA